MAIEDTLRAVDELLRPPIESLGYELVDLQLRSERGRRILRVLVDRPGGITLDECVRLSREISPHLEVADPIPGSYVLEVSSPGVRRPLKGQADFERFRGERVVIRTRQPVDGRHNFKGVNLGLDEQGHVVLEQRDTGARFRIPLRLIKQARLDPDLRV
ncbi:MAG: ribosome maturation factor RimP [Deferrisomatales bacterium]